MAASKNFPANKNASARSKAKVKAKTRSTQERIDDEIMHVGHVFALLPPSPSQKNDTLTHLQTNDSSITSKRCVSKLYFPDEPDFYEPFCPKYVRRNPLINRGYWLRMHAVEQAVLLFLQETTAKPKIVVNLGCG